MAPNRPPRADWIRAAASAEPYRVTLDEGKWNGRDTYAKHSGTPDGFGSQIRAAQYVQQLKFNSVRTAAAYV